MLGSHGFGGDDEVGFVFAVCVVEDDYELAITCGAEVLAARLGCGGKAEEWLLRKAWMVSGIESNSDLSRAVALMLRESGMLFRDYIGV